MMPTHIPPCFLDDRSDRELLEERLAFGDSKLKVARILLATLDEQNELGNLTATEQDLLYYAIDMVLMKH